MTQSYFRKYKGLHIFSTIILLFWLALSLYMVVSVNNGGFASPAVYKLAGQISFAAQALSLILLLIQLLLLIFYDYVKTSAIFFGLAIALFILVSTKGLADDFAIFFVNPELLYIKQETQLDRILYIASMALGYGILVGEILGMIFARDREEPVDLENSVAEDIEIADTEASDKEEAETEADAETDQTASTFAATESETEPATVEDADPDDTAEFDPLTGDILEEKATAPFPRIHDAELDESAASAAPVHESTAEEVRAEDQPVDDPLSQGEATRRELEALYGKAARPKHSAFTSEPSEPQKAATSEATATSEPAAEPAESGDSDSVADQIRQRLGGRDVTPKN